MADTTAPVYNVCSGRPTSILELGSAIGCIVGVAPEFRFAAPRQGDIRHSLGNPSSAQAALGFTASTELNEGLMRTLQRPGAAKDDRLIMDRFDI